jgi:hypothetical protein
MGGEISLADLRQELEASRKQLMDFVGVGFGGIHSRQDITNGRIDTNEKRLNETREDVARMEAQIANLSKEVFNRRADDRRSTDRQQPSPGTDTVSQVERAVNLPMVTTRDVKITVAVVGVIVGVVKFIPMAIAALKAALLR